MDPHALLLLVGTTARLTTAVILALAAAYAMRDWPAFAIAVEQYRIGPAWTAPLAARLLPPLEMATALALPLPATGRIGATMGLVLMTLFSMAIAVNLARGRTTIECGCGGARGQRLSAGLVVRNLVLAGALVIAMQVSPGLPAGGIMAISVGGATLTLVAIYFASNQLMVNRQGLGALAAGSGA